MFLVINGLARGGTNLLGNIFAAQRNFFSSEASLCEFLCIDEYLPYDYYIKYPKNANEPLINTFIDTSINVYLNKTIENIYKVINPSFTSIKTNYHNDFNSYYGISINQWSLYVNLLSEVKKLSDFQQVYRKFSEHIGIPNLVQRTTALTNYSSYFLSRSPNNYWLEIIRDPFDRCSSSMIGHSQIPEQSFLQSKWQLNNLLDSSTPRYKVISYESLCENPEQLMSELFDWINVDFPPIIKTVGPDQTPFYGNSSDNPEIFDQVKKENIIYKTSINRKKKLTKKDIKIGTKIMKNNNVPFIYFFMLLFCSLLNILIRSLYVFKYSILIIISYFKISYRKINLLKIYTRIKSF